METSVKKSYYNPEYSKKYYEKNKERIIEKQRAYDKKRYEKIKANRPPKKSKAEKKEEELRNKIRGEFEQEFKLKVNSLFAGLGAGAYIECSS